MSLFEQGCYLVNVQFDKDQKIYELLCFSSACLVKGVHGYIQDTKKVGKVISAKEFMPHRVMTEEEFFERAVMIIDEKEAEKLLMEEAFEYNESYRGIPEETDDLYSLLFDEFGNRIDDDKDSY